VNARAVAPWRERLVAVDDLEPGARVVVGCSGGADSLALLVLSSALGFAVVAVYVDHGLRRGTELDARVVGQAAQRVGAGFRRVAVELEPGGNLEARARDARYAALERERAQAGASAVFVGHTRDDQAETVLLHVMRGSGFAGLAGIPPRRGSVRRPLLGLRRADTHEICLRAGLAPVQDPMNDDIGHRRVWVRRELIPRLERGADRDLVEVLARQADVMRDDDAVLEELAGARATDDVAMLRALPPALARRVVRRFVGTPPPSLATIERIMRVVHGEATATELPGGGRAERIGGRLVRIPGARPALPAEPVTLPLPGRTEFGALVLEAWVEEGPPVAWPDGRWRAVCDADLVPAEAEVRTAGAGVPEGRRAVTPVVTAGGPLWRVGYGIDRRVRVTTRTRRFLWLTAEPSSE
jgi:tRNA(Ile)-lysidine synthase